MTRWANRCWASPSCCKSWARWSSRKLSASKFERIVMVFAALDPTYIVPVAIFGAFAALAWWVIEWWTSRNTRAAERLEELRDPRGRRVKEMVRQNKASLAMAKVLEKATPAL